MVKVLVMSVDLPCTFYLTAARTTRHVPGPSAGIRPVGLSMPFWPSRAEMYAALPTPA